MDRPSICWEETIGDNTDDDTGFKYKVVGVAIVGVLWNRR